MRNAKELPVILAALMLSGFLFLSSISEPHKCRFRGCPFTNYEKWEPELSECEPGADCYIVDSLHFAHPGLTGSQLENKLWGTTGHETRFY